MKVILAPDSFKGSMTSKEIIKITRNVMESHFPGSDFVEIPIADGGEGTIEALLHSGDGLIGQCQAKDPFGRHISAPYGLLGDVGIVEMAAVSGLTLMAENERNPLIASSYGTGQVIAKLLDMGCQKLVIGIGGSGTNDGGTGAMEALGVRFYDDMGGLLSPMCGRRLAEIETIDVSELDPRLRDVNIQVMCDVTNPLTGPEGATYVYGPQKGADEPMLQVLEAGMCHYRVKLEATFGVDYGALPGAGAAGGIGAALVAFLKGDLVRGIDKVLEISRFEEHMSECQMVITGEGRVDGQSANGKVVHGIVSKANKAKLPVVVIAGGVDQGVEQVYDLGINSIFTLPDSPMSLDQAMRDSKKLLAFTVDNMCRLMKLT